MTKVAKTDNISFYFKLCELIENNKGPKGLVAKLDGVIAYIKKAVELDGTYDAESEEYVEVLKYWKERFEESQQQDPSWQVYLGNGRQKITVNLRPIREMVLSAEWEPATTLENMVDHITNELLSSDTVTEYKQIRETLKQLQLFFNDWAPAVTRFKD